MEGVNVADDTRNIDAILAKEVSTGLKKKSFHLTVVSRV
jgi:hypothetical protein